MRCASGYRDMNEQTQHQFNRPNRDAVRRNLRRPDICCYCRRKLLRGLENSTSDDPAIRGQCESTEHLDPQSKGGTHAIENLTLACQRCNSLRGSIHHEIFMMFAQQVLQRWPDAPAITLRAALHDFILDLAEIAIRNKREARSAVSRTADRVEKWLKDPNGRLRR